jgi:hypothetical protein
MSKSFCQTICELFREPLCDAEISSMFPQLVLMVTMTLSSYNDQVETMKTADMLLDDVMDNEKDDAIEKEKNLRYMKACLRTNGPAHEIFTYSSKWVDPLFISFNKVYASVCGMLRQTGGILICVDTYNKEIFGVNKVMYVTRFLMPKNAQLTTLIAVKKSARLKFRRRDISDFPSLAKKLPAFVERIIDIFRYKIPMIQEIEFDELSGQYLFRLITPFEEKPYTGLLHSDDEDGLRRLQIHKWGLVLHEGTDEILYEDVHEIVERRKVCRVNTIVNVLKKKDWFYASRMLNSILKMEVMKRDMVFVQQFISPRWLSNHMVDLEKLKATMEVVETEDIMKLVEGNTDIGPCTETAGGNNYELV